MSDMMDQEPLKQRLREGDDLHSRIEAADRIEALEALLETAHPMLDRLAHYEGTINQPSAELAEQIRTVLDASEKSPKAAHYTSDRVFEGVRPISANETTPDGGEDDLES